MSLFWLRITIHPPSAKFCTSRDSSSVVATGRPEHDGALCTWQRERRDAGAQEGVLGTDSGGYDCGEW